MISALTLGSTAMAPVVMRSSPVRMVATIDAKAQDTDFCYGLPGNIAPAGNFDPAQILEGKTKGDVYRLREAEITHGEESPTHAIRLPRRFDLPTEPCLHF